MTIEYTHMGFMSPREPEMDAVDRWRDLKRKLEEKLRRGEIPAEDVEGVRYGLDRIHHYYKI
ncbi:hypothetical protein HYT24_01170 [Candidatus Pacearchaeota archaeon]|nr:hypothetical protein [Candidatus Pacearchaeota archaeon]